MSDSLEDKGQMEILYELLTFLLLVSNRLGMSSLTIIISNLVQQRDVDCWFSYRPLEFINSDIDASVFENNTRSLNTKVSCQPPPPPTKPVVNLVLMNVR